MTQHKAQMPDGEELTALDSGVEAALRALSVPAGSGPPPLTGADVVYAEHDSAAGRLLLAARTGGALVACAFAGQPARAAAVVDRIAAVVSPRVLRQGPASGEAGQALDRARRQLDAYLAGTVRRFQVDVDLALATPFQREVLPALAAVGYGERVSYGALAARLGRPRAARAVGAALGANPLCVVLPCHRVVAGSGALTGYAGGLEVKRMLLDLEAAGASGAGRAGR